MHIFLGKNVDEDYFREIAIFRQNDDPKPISNKGRDDMASFYYSKVKIHTYNAIKEFCQKNNN